jgi:hypothetical protein
VPVVAIGSVRSCGTTTAGLALAAAWPEVGRRRLVVEADPAGGTIATLAGWPTEPSLMTLAAAARRGGTPSLVWEHCHEFACQVAVVAGPATAEQSRTAMAIVKDLLLQLSDPDALVVIDCGRLDPGSPALEVWAGTDWRLLAVRCQLADLHSTAAWLQALSVWPPAGLVVIGDGAYPDSEIAAALGVDVAARLPWDSGGTNALVTNSASGRAWRLSPLARAAHSLGERLSAEAVKTTADRDALEPAPPEPGDRKAARPGWRETGVEGAWNGSRRGMVPR